MRGVLWVLVLLSALLAGAGFILGMLMSSSAPQQGATAAAAAAAVIIPYCLARAWDELKRKP